MLDYQRIVEEIQAAVLSQGTLDWELLRDTAAEYATACDEVNERLTKCERLLKQGLRSEAIQVADAEPNLLDAVAILDFPELADWRQLLGGANMVLPPPIRIEVAADLNAAYAAELPLQSLLKRHRLLALSRAPLCSRIEVLREIRLADIMNEVWTDDLRVIELARHQELERSFDVALKQRNLEEAKALAAEAADPGWVYSPRPEFVQRAQGRRNALAATLAAEALEGVELDLANAYSAFDIEAGQQARERWKATQAVARLPENHPLVTRAAAALKWLADQDHRSERERSFAASCVALEFELEREADKTTLERLFHAAQRFEEEIPLLLVRRYEERIRSLEATARRRFVLATTAVVGAILLVGVATGWYFIHAQHEGLVAKASAALGRLVSDGNVSEAQRYLTDLTTQHPAIATRPEVQQEAGRLQALLDAEQQRLGALEALLARAAKAGPDNPDRVALVEATKLAVTGSEKERVAELQAEVAARERQRQRDRDETFEKAFRQLLSQVELVESEMQIAQITDANQIATLIAEADALQNRAGGVSEALSGQLRPIRVRLTSLQQQNLTRRFEAEALSDLASRVGRPGEYRDALNGFVQKFATAPLTASFKRVLDEHALWDGTTRWSEFLSEPRFKSLKTITPDFAKELLSRGDVLLAECSGVPLADEYRTRQAFLKSVAARIDEAGKSRADALQRLFDDPLVSSLSMVTVGGECYYITAESNIKQVTTDGRMKIEYLAGFDLSTRSIVVPKDDITYSGPSPQKRLVASVDGPLNKIRLGDWERGSYELLTAVAGQKDLDPLLKIILLRRVIEVARTGSHSLHVALKPLAERLNASDLDLTANWLLPKEASSQRARLQAEQALKALSKVEEYGQQAAQLYRDQTAAPSKLPVWIGWLRPRGKDAWICQTESETPSAGELFVIISGAGADGFPRGLWFQVGTCTESGPRWSAEATTNMLAGRPVFWVDTSSTPPALTP